jgi:regulator of sigma E protease
MSSFLWSFGGFLIAIGVLVAFHEFGHYWVARRCGVKVLRFSIGFGRPLWTRRSRDGVEWTISAIPLGGYVKMLDEREGPVAPSERSQAFNNASVGRRIAIVAAGPAFNFLLAIAFYWLVMVIGVEGIRSVIAAPGENTVAAQAGLQQRDEIVSVGGEPTPTWTELRTELIDRALAGGQLPVEVRSADQTTRSVTLNLGGVRVDPEFLFQDLGLDIYQPPIPPVMGDVMPGSAAEAAGIRSGDRVIAVNGEPMPTWQELVKWVGAHPGEVAKIEVERGGQPLTLNAIVARVHENGRDLGRLGVGVAAPPELWQDLRAENRLNPLAAVPAAIEQTWRISALTLKMLWRMVLGDVSVKNVSGPIQIAQVAGFSAQVGLVSFLSFMAVVSVSLGVLNLLPVPLLDGGHLLFYGVEAVKGSPVSLRMQEAGQRVGMTFLMLMMGLAFYNDVMRLLN